MKKKIIFSMSCIALLSILLSMVLSGVVSYYDSLEIVKKATIAESRYIQNGIALGGDDYLSDVRSAGYDTAAAQSVRVTVIDTDGTVRFDSVADAANMENHNNRPEVIAARENGAGESVRESDTLNVQSYNYAVMLSDGRVLRLSVGMKTVFGSIERMVPWMLLCSVVILVLAAAFALAAPERDHQGENGRAAPQADGVYRHHRKHARGLHCGGCKGRCAFVQHERCAPFGRAPGGRPPTERAGV